MNAFRNWLLEDPAARVPLALTVLGALLVLPLVIFSIYILRMGSRAIERGEFPPHGYRVIDPTTRLTGDRAVRQGRLIRVLGILLIGAAIAVVAILWRLGVVLGRAQA